MGESDGKPKGESDPLFHPPNLKTRKTVMGLAPAPHLGGSTPAEVAAEAEARKERVLGRRPSTMPLGTTIEDAILEPSKRSLTGTAIMTPNVPLTLPAEGPARTSSSDARIPSTSGWEVHDRSKDSVPEMHGEVVEPPPNTARMARAAAPAPEAQRMTPSYAPPPELRAPPASRMGTLVEPQAPANALALRREEPSFGPKHGIAGTLDRRLELLVDPHSARSASFRLLRDSLQSRSMPRVVAVTSATVNDGKTTCAVNLAIALAEQAATRVLIIDGNFFEPELAKIFNLERLTPIAFDDSTGWLAPYRIAGVTPTLHVAGVVRAPGEPVRFEQARFDAMVDRLCRVAYDYIIIDAPAMRATPAVIQMIAIADGAILAVRSGATSSGDLRRAVDAIPAKKALGITLVDAPQE